MVTYPNDGIIKCANNMILDSHADAAYLNIIKVRSCAGAYIILSENDPNLRHNGPIFTISQIIKFFMSSAAEAELAGLFIDAKDIILLHKNLS